MQSLQCIHSTSLLLYSFCLANNGPETFPPAARYFFIIWLVFMFFATAMYECNLRAYLMAVDFEPEINTDLDIYVQDKARTMYLNAGNNFDNYVP